MKYAIIIVAVSILISLTLGIFLVWPQYRGFRDIQSQLNQKELQLENQNKYIQSLKVAKKEMDERSDIVSKIESALPIGSDAPSLLEFLQNASASSGISLDNISLEKASPGDEKERVKSHFFSAELSGSYFSFKNFLFALETSSRLIEVEQTNFSVPLTEGQSALIKIRARISSY
ncbi:type 4a pilus biogenesis protein PilO [Patescibacteria group bacterium]|nr:type 4a pilus biogenesis protein PilO [Patescibacteria group bacterium]MBU4162258.1 type 4a pilus biogenesis protein PilO [Patescibacteria group bacterium]